MKMSDVFLIQEDANKKYTLTMDDAEVTALLDAIDYGLKEFEDETQTETSPDLKQEIQQKLSDLKKLQDKLISQTERRGDDKPGSGAPLGNTSKHQGKNPNTGNFHMSRGDLAKMMKSKKK